MTLSAVRLATRASALALWQANHVAAMLRPVTAPRPVTLVPIETHGDRDQSSALAGMGGFGVFTKAIQQALLDEKADVAVHSLKDLPTLVTEGVTLVATPPRGPSGDAFVSRIHSRFDDLPSGAMIGTSSLRRAAMIRSRRPDLRIVPLRGNVETRLHKLDEQQWAGIVLAEAGLTRLGLSHRITERLDPTWMLPAVGQGAIGLECRNDDRRTIDLATMLNDPETLARITAERTMLATLGGGCLVPIGATSNIENDLLTLRAMVLSADGVRKVAATHTGPAASPKAIGLELAAMLISEGAADILRGSG
jgi:hydroxymethylbilane synthase